MDKDIVGEDLYLLILEQGLPVVSVSRVSVLWSTSWDRAAFRLALADGTVCKGRRFESQETADRVRDLGRFVPDGIFPRVVAHRGIAHISEWVEGTLLSSCQMTGELLRRAGAIAGAIHAVDLPSDTSESIRPPARTWRQELEDRVDLLCREGELTASEGAQALALAETHAPSNVHVGLVQGDLCPENLVLDGSGSLRVIDTDSLAIRAKEYDLARTWYRWPMTSAEREAFEDGYQSRAVLASYHAHFLHWAVSILIRATYFRRRHKLPDAGVPAQRLRELLLEHSA